MKVARDFNWDKKANKSSAGDYEARDVAKCPDAKDTKAYIKDSKADLNKESVLVLFTYRAGKSIASDNQKSFEKTDYSVIKNFPRKVKVLLSELNQSQLDATLCKARNICITAGAGTGKTKTLVARIAYLLAKGMKPQKIKVLAFTKKAANEIKNRLINIFGDAAKEFNIQTIHGWCFSILRKAPKLFRFGSRKVLSTLDVWDLFSIIIFEEKQRRSTDFIDNFHLTSFDVAQLYEYIKETNAPLVVALHKYYRSEIKDENIDFLCLIFKLYEIRKRAKNYIDFTDMIKIVVERIERLPNIAQWLGKQYSDILLDEMQDISRLQWRLLFCLSRYCRLFCVGDDAQAIYGFRGGNPQYMQHFTIDIKESVTQKLLLNYRSTQSVLDLSNWLLTESKINYSKKLISARAINGDKIIPQIHTFENINDETKWIVNNIAKRKDSGCALIDIAVIVRTGKCARDIESRLLSETNIPYKVIGGKGLMGEAHVEDVIAVLRIIYDSSDEIAWKKYISLFVVKESATLKILGRVMSVKGFENKINLLHKSMKAAAEILLAINNMKVSLPLLIGEIVRSLYFYLSKKYANLRPAWEERKEDFRFVKLLANKHNTIRSFLESFVFNASDNEVQNCGKGDAPKDFLTIITAHGAKGTEYKTCFVAFCNPLNYPSDYFVNSSKGDEYNEGNIGESDIEEERRVLYVALTRAKDELIITRSKACGLYCKKEELEKTETLYNNKYLLQNIPSNLFKQVIHNKGST